MLFDEMAPRAGVSEPTAGRDEMNLAEFPLTLLADRVPKQTKTLCYASRNGTLVVSGSDAYGLPTAADADVIIGLIQLTRLRNNFADPKVPFTRYELLRVLGWPDESKYYKRLDESLNRWVGVTLHYQNSWWDNRAKRYLSAKLHILETVILDEKPGRRARGAPPGSSFTWNAMFIESCQADNLKRLDLDTYFSFRSAVAKRMYRFLDKRFYLRPDWTFDLKEFAFEYVGLSRNYEGNAGKIKEKLRPAIEELEAIEFLAPMGREERYTRIGTEWTIRLAQLPGPAALPAATVGQGGTAPAGPCRTELLTTADGAPVMACGLDAVVSALVVRGVTRSTAEQLAGQYPADQIGEKVAIFDWLLTRRDRRVGRSPAGFLVDSIRKDYAAPRDFPGASSGTPDPSGPGSGAPAVAPPSPTAAEFEAQESAQRDRIAEYLDRLTPADRERTTQAALAAASSYFRTRYQRLRDENPERAGYYLDLIVDQHVAGLLTDAESSAQEPTPEPTRPAPTPPRRGASRSQ